MAGITYEVERINFMVADYSRLDNTKKSIFAFKRFPVQEGGEGEVAVGGW